MSGPGRSATGATAFDPTRQTMRCCLMTGFGGPEVLSMAEVPVPEPRHGEVRVRVHAVSVGRTLDIAARGGHLPFARIEPPHILGAEHAGVVDSVGSGVENVRPGERVAVFPAISCGRCRFCEAGRQESCQMLELIGVHRPGAYAEYSCVPARNLHRIPDDVSDVDAAALALSAPVAVYQLDQAAVGEGSWVLVQAAGSALGSATVMAALHRGARVIATSRRDWKRQRLLELGVAAALDPTSAQFADEVFSVTGGEGVDVIVDDIGSQALWEAGLTVLTPTGTIITSGAFVGEPVQLDLRSFYTRSLRVIGVRTANCAAVTNAWRAVGAGLRPVVDRTFPLEAAEEAHRYLERDENFGRVILRLAR